MNPARAAVGVLLRRVLAVLLITILLAAPAAILLELSSRQDSSSAAFSMGGAVLQTVASVAIALVLLAHLRPQPPTIRSIGRVIADATLRVIAAELIAGILVGLLMFLCVLLLFGIGAPPAILVLAVLAILVFTSPVLLVTPVVVVEQGDPWWSLNRAWALSKPRRWLVRLSLSGYGALWAGGSFLLSTSDTQMTAMAGVVMSVSGVVIGATLFAAFYIRLTADERAAAAAGAAAPPESAAAD